MGAADMLLVLLLTAAEAWLDTAAPFSTLLLLLLFTAADKGQTLPNTILLLVLAGGVINQCLVVYMLW
jgi:hypothetical protein